jgi:glycosyltransferase involved in cell wall biosynthesis
MNILNIIQCTNLGGMEHSNLLRLKYYMEKGHNVRVVSLHPPGLGAKLYEAAGIPVSGCEYLGKFGLLTHYKLRGIVKSHPADIVFVTGASLSSCLAASIHHVPLILFIHYHHGSSIASKIKWGIFYRIIGKKFDKISFCSDFIRTEAEVISPGLSKKFLTLRNIFELPSYSKLSDQHKARRNLGLPLDVPIIGNAGWLIQRKRFDLFLEVAANVMKEVHNLHIAIAGSGNLEPSLKHYSHQLGLTGRISWLNWLPNLTDFYRSLDVLIFNSDFDALGRTPIEAMAHNIPVVSSVSYGGLSEVIINGENGYLLAEHDVDKLAFYTIKLITNDTLRNEMANNGRKWVENNLSITKITPYLDQLLSDIFLK